MISPPPANISTLETSERLKANAKLTRFVIAGLLVAIVCAFAGVVRCDFIDLDDRSHVLENPLVRQGLSWAGIVSAFTTPHASLWIPLTWISFMTDVSVFGLNPGAMHAENLVLHAASALLLFFALRKMTGRLWESAAVAALFGLHPLNVESVAWITERKNVLCAFFWMFTLGAYARYAERPRVGWYFAALAAFGFALLAKPLAVTLPFALVLLDFWPLRRHERLGWRRLAVEKLPFLTLGLAGALMEMRAVHARGQTVSLELVSAPVRISNALTSYATYLGDLVWPARLGVFYQHPLRVQAVAAGFAAFLLVAVSLLAWWQRRRRPQLLFGWLWFLGTLVPMIGLVQAGSQARADRFTYIAQIGVFIAVVWLLAELKSRRILAWGSAFVFAALAVVTAHQVTFWTDSVTLFEHTRAVTSPNARIEALVAQAYTRNEDYAVAAPHYQASLRLLADMPETWNDYGAALTHLGRDPEAAQSFAQALQFDPQLTSARYNLASALARLGRREEAIGQFRQLAQAMPDFGRVQYHLGRLLAEEGHRDEALGHLQIAARLLPNDSEIRGALAKLN